ncbi:MAG: hypothetical protein ACI3XQ_11340 [Eubacteriales bacterium]
MKARIPEREKHIRQIAREAIRVMINNCAKITLIEEFEMGGSGERIERIQNSVNRLIDSVTSSGRGSREALNRLKDILSAECQIDLQLRKGHGEKVEIGDEHDLVYGAWLYVLRKQEKFGQKRLDRFQDGLNERIRYYNRVFQDDVGVVNEVMQNRLYQYGCRTAETIPGYTNKVYRYKAI